MAEEKNKRFITVMILPESSGAEVKRLRIPRRALFGAAGGAVLLVLLVFGLSIHNAALLAQLEDDRRVRSENVRLRAELQDLDDRVQGISRVVERVQQFDARLRKMTMVSDPERNLAIGPVGQGPDKVVLERDPLVLRNEGELRRDLLGPKGIIRDVELVGNHVEAIGRDAQAVESSVRALQLFLEDQQTLLGSTPSIIPARGWLTSGFGFRTDPYTGLRTMHAGLDVSADIGTKVIATADGLVVHAGTSGAYGNVVQLDHGHGLVTMYAHLSVLHVREGGEVKRGTLIGEVGNTGRSTGPHLHYEVRLNGVPQDPRRFILE